MSPFWLVGLLTVVGSLLVARKRREGFVIWMLTNGIWIIRNIYIGEYPQAALYCFHMVMAIYAFWFWGKKEKFDAKSPNDRKD